jgi:hypothetical protein
MELASALADNVFYHVALLEDLPRIAEEGLRPRQETGRDNFPDILGVDEECVYLWPNVMAAWSWMQEDREGRFTEGERVVLRVSGLDLGLLSPDHEEFGRFLEEPEHFLDGEETYRELLARGVWDAERNEALAATRRDAWHDHTQARDLLRTVPDDLRSQLANSFATTGEAVMYRGLVPAAALEVATLNLEDDLLEAFAEHYQSPYQGDHEPTPEEEEAYNAAMEEFFAGRQVISVEEMQARRDYLDEWPENREEQYFSFSPLSELVPPRPELSTLDAPSTLELREPATPSLTV